MTKVRRSRITAVSLTITGLFFSYGHPSFAQSATENRATATRSAKSNAPQPIQFGATSLTNKLKLAAATAGNTNDAAAQVNDLKTEQALLRQMAEAIKRTRRPVVDMINECFRPLAPAVGGVGGDLDIREGDIIPDPPPITEFAGKYAPPRKKYMKLHMSQLESLIPFLQDEIDNLKIPDSEKDFAAQPMEDIDGYMGDIELHFKKLKAIAKSGNFNQVATINECRGLDASCKAIDEARKILLHVDETTEKKDQKLEKKEGK